VTLFVDRLQQALLAESATFLAADQVISSSEPLDPIILEEAQSLGLQTSTTMSFLSMVFSEDRAQFSSVKAVDKNYPLRGRLIAGDEPFMRGTPVDDGPKPGEIWMESRLFPALGVSKGDFLDVGVASIPVTRVLIKEPDRGGGFNSAGPRVLMNLADVPRTEVVRPGSRLTYRYLFAGERGAISEFVAWVKPRLDSDTRVLGIKEGAQGIGDALERGERFLLLGSLLGVVLAGVAIALAAQRYSLRHYDHVAIMKTLGATPKVVDLTFVTIFLILGSLATLLGAAIGYLMQLGVAEILSPYIPIELPEPSMRPVLLGLITGFVCLLSFALPPLLKLRTIEPVRVIRRDLGEAGISDWLTYSFGVVGTLSLMWWYSGDIRLTVMIFSGAVVSLILLFFVAHLLLRSGRVLGMQAGSAWRLALAGMQRRGRENTLQILVFGLAIMLLLIIYLVRTALIIEWQAQIPEDAPNHFAINISPEDVSPIRELFAENDVASQPLYPMIRGRIITVNDELATDRDKRLGRSADGGPGSSSGRNLTWSNTLPDDNKIIAGDWWSENHEGRPLVSLEKDMAYSNGLRVGDELVFTIQGRELGARVESIRTVAWDNMQPNFYIIFSPGALDDFPSTFMTSFHLPKDRKLFLNDLLGQYPTMTVIEIDALIEQVQRIIEQVTLAIELVLVLIVGSGALVLLASIQASMDERLKQHAILRTLGAGRRLILGSLAIEFCALGFFAGILATLGAEITVFVLNTQIFELEYSMNPQLWLLGPVVGVLLIGFVGTFATRRVVDTPPASVLRELA
ncbi:MAG: FtsX-like permease family protein, partial [Gammaproteobacteria bacterium]|nr:FtsX-like permease family protein [Gammaproteobacteria bacterium]